VEALHFPLRMLTCPTRGIGDGRTRGPGAAQRAAIVGQRPEGSGFGASRPRIENRGAGFVHEVLRGSPQIGHARIRGGPRIEGGATNPVRNDGAVKIYPWRL
jgi:hypothetical protein